MSETPKNWEAKLVDWIPPELELTQVQKDLLAAADWLRRNEWCQGALHIGSASCMVGSLLRVTGSDGLRTERAVIHLGALGFSPKWNDAPGRTKEEVVLALLATALAK